jgi:hypothetical protein
VTKWTAPLKTSSEELNASSNFSARNQTCLIFSINRCACLSQTVAPVYHKPLRLFITPDRGRGQEAQTQTLLGFSLKPFFKRLAGKQFFEKACERACST